MKAKIMKFFKLIEVQADEIQENQPHIVVTNEIGDQKYANYIYKQRELDFGFCGANGTAHVINIRRLIE